MREVFAPPPARRAGGGLAKAVPFRTAERSRRRAMARPKKQPHERRSASVRSDLTVAEKCYVQQQAAEAGLSEAEYTRRRVLCYAVKAVAAGSACDPALVSEINRLGREVSALGNLVNQVALYCHTDRRMRPEWQLLPGEIKQLRRLVEAKLEEVVPIDGP